MHKKLGGNIHFCWCVLAIQENMREREVYSTVCPVFRSLSQDGL